MKQTEIQMNRHLKVLFVDAGSGFYRVNRYPVGEFFGPVDLGLHLAGSHNSLNIGTGLLAGSIFPGSNRLFFSGFSPCWGTFYISSMGGAGLVFDNLGINMVAIVGRAARPSVLILNRAHGEEIMVDLEEIDIEKVWRSGREGVYGLTDLVLRQYGGRYENDPRILVTGPASLATDFGAIGSVPVYRGQASHVDTWAGRGGFGSKMLAGHGIAAVIYGGTFIDEDFRDRSVADQWFQDRYAMKVSAKDLEATAKYRFDPDFQTGGTFGVNFAGMGGRLLAFNYQTIYRDETERLDLHRRFVLEHYLKQFNEETIVPKQQKNCGEPCVAVCKKMRAEYKKDYEPYQAMGPLCGIFDQRAAELLNRHADRLGFDAISVGGVLAWLLECLAEGDLSPEDLGVSGKPDWNPAEFDLVESSNRNARLAVEILDSIIGKKGLLDLSLGARHLARRLAGSQGKQSVLDRFVYCANTRRGWVVPNQYWTPGVLSPMPIMGKYYMYYGTEFFPPRELGRRNAQRFRQELILDNLGFCRFHRAWAEEMGPEIIGSLFDLKDRYLEVISVTAGRINSRNSAVFWESARNADFIHAFLKRQIEVLGQKDAELVKWHDYFSRDRAAAALDFWYEIHKGIHESLRES